MPQNRALRCAAGLLGPGEGHVPSWGDLRALRPSTPCPGPTCLLGVVAEHWVEQEEQPGGQSTGVDGCKAASRPLSCLGGLGSRALATCLPSRCPPRPDSGAAVPSPGPGPTGRAGHGRLRPALALGSGPTRASRLPVSSVSSSPLKCTGREPGWVPPRGHLRTSILEGTLEGSQRLSVSALCLTWRSRWRRSRL